MQEDYQPLIKIIRIGHKGASLRPKNNGEIGRKTINKGVSQGSPISAYLFIIYAESMMGIWKSLKRNDK